MDGETVRGWKDRKMQDQTEGMMEGWKVAGMARWMEEWKDRWMK